MTSDMFGPKVDTAVAVVPGLFLLSPRALGATVDDLAAAQGRFAAATRAGEAATTAEARAAAAQEAANAMTDISRLKNPCPSIVAMADPRLNAQLKLQQILAFRKIVAVQGPDLAIGQGTRVAVFDTVTGTIYYGPGAGLHMDVVAMMPGAQNVNATGRFLSGAVRVTETGNVSWTTLGASYPIGELSITEAVLNDLIRGTGASVR